MKEGISIVIPIHNEYPGIKFLWEELQRQLGYFEEKEIIFVDDGSHDESRYFLQGVKGIKLISHDEKRGYGAALKTGIRNSCYNYICIMDGDGSYSPEYIRDFYALRKDYDMVIGMREEIIFPFTQKVARFLIFNLLSLVFRRKVKDVNSGFRLVRRECLLDYLDLLPNGFSFTSSLSLLMLLDKKKICYFSIKYRKRRGKSKMKRISYSYQFLTSLLSSYGKWLRGKIFS